MNQEIHSELCKIRAISEKPNSTTLVVGTRGGEICEIDPETKATKFISRGHYDHELWGLDVHPTKPSFVTVGEDFLLAKWDLTTRAQISHCHMKYQAKVVSYNNEGTKFIVGCKNGKCLIFDDTNSKLAPETHEIGGNRSKEISVIKFSPQDKYLAIGAHDSKILTYNAQTFEFLTTLRGHHSTITHLDFSINGEFLHSTCTSYELLFWDSQTGKQVTSGASAYCDENWATWTTTLGFPVGGIYPPCSDGLDINAVDRSKSKKLLATADDFGKVKLFKFPQPNKKAAFQRFVGHSSHVTNVKFAAGDSHVISTGGNDKAIFVWKLIFDKNLTETNYDDSGFDPSEFDYQKPEKNAENGKVSAPEPMGMFSMAEEETGDQFMAVKPWLGQVEHSVPEQYKLGDPLDKVPPETNLTPHYVHGYRCFDARQTAKFVDAENICFVSAALGVTMNLPENTQKFFRAHDEDLVSFDMTGDRKVAASGSMPAKGRSRFVDIYVWDVETKETLAHLTGFHRGSIKLLKFSPDGSKLASFGQDDDNSLAVYDWENSRLICTAKVDKSAVLGCGWENEQNFCTVGQKHIKMWS
jgi:WD40 repeat protein